ncbi:hypothetical protein ACLQ22_28840 [Micromonospora sp. DT178]
MDAVRGVDPAVDNGELIGPLGPTGTDEITLTPLDPRGARPDRRRTS